MPNDLYDDIYTENDIYYAIADGEVYIEPNIRCKLSNIETYIYHAYPDDSEFLIDFETMYVETILGSAADPITNGYMEFKDGSYMRLELSPTWSSGEVPLITNMAFNLYFGLKDPTTETVTEYLIATATGLSPNKRYWLPNPSTTPPSWSMTELLYIPGDTFRLYFGWWNSATPKFRYIFVPYSSGAGVYNLEEWKNSLNRNVLSSGAQGVINITTETGQILAAYLCGGYTGSTEYPGEDSETGGGEGTFYNRNDAVGLPAIPGLQAIDLGFTTLYNPHEADVRALASWLWSDDFTDNIKMNYADPLNNILGINFIALPEGMINNEASTFVIGNCDSNIQTMKVSTGNKNQYVELDCGDINLPEYWQNFLDYDTQFNIWLPYIGFRSLRADDILQATEDNGGYLNVTYYIDLLTGCAVCHLISKIEDNATHRMVEHLLYSFNCNVFYSTPISGANYTSMYNQQVNAVSSGINTAVSALGQAMKGDVMGAVGSVASLITGGARSKMEYDTAKPDYGRSGNNGGNAGYFSYKKPYIIRTQAIGQTPKNYKKLQGIPSQIYSKLESLSGYTEIDRVITDTLTSCTSEEKEDIIRMLKNGVVL